MAQIEVGKDMIQIDADVLARAFGVSQDDLKWHMRKGTITSRSERGDDVDIGKIRLTFFSDDRRVCIIADESGAILTCDTALIDRSPRLTSHNSRIDDLLDEALDETFPASDPISIDFTSPQPTTPSSKDPNDG